MDEGSLRLPGKMSSQRVFEPDQIKEAAGLGRAMTFPDEEETPDYSVPEAPRPSGKQKLSPLPTKVEPNPLFIKMEEMDEVKYKIKELSHINKAVETSEYNEEHNFVKLRRAVRGVHDRLLLADKIVFKA